MYFIDCLRSDLNLQPYDVWDPQDRHLSAELPGLLRTEPFILPTL